VRRVTLMSRGMRHASLETRKATAMTLIVLDPRSGNSITVTVPDRPRLQQPVPATVIRHPKCAA
jgi:hypothetical protein